MRLNEYMKILANELDESYTSIGVELNITLEDDGIHVRNKPNGNKVEFNLYRVKEKKVEKLGHIITARRKNAKKPKLMK